eukprot:4127272-Lingulodinium_polyedra.AAC.1
MAKFAAMPQPWTSASILRPTAGGTFDQVLVHPTVPSIWGVSRRRIRSRWGRSVSSPYRC